jgi:hypothetical protein
MNPSEEFRKFAGECRTMAKLARSQRVKRHGAAWPRDGFGALSSTNSTRRRQCLTGQQSDIEGPSVAGLTAMMTPTQLKSGAALAAATISIGTTHVDQLVAV